LQRAHPLIDEHIGIGARIGGEQLLQLQFFLSDQGVEFIHRQAFFAHASQLAGDQRQIAVEFIVRRFDVNGALRALEQHAAVKADADVFDIVFA